MPIPEENLRFYKQNLEMAAQAQGMAPAQLELAILQRKFGLLQAFSDSDVFFNVETKKPTLRERVNRVTRRINRG